VPLLAFDAWEHAYYLQYKNVRPDFVKAMWQVVNWEDIAARYTAAVNTARGRRRRDRGFGACVAHVRGAASSSPPAGGRVHCPLEIGQLGDHRRPQQLIVGRGDRADALLG
jgi:hypothetical protein